MTKKVLVTGVAGFIGRKVAESLMLMGINVIGIDSVTDYYDVKLKINRLNTIRDHSLFSYHNTDITNYDDLNDVFANSKPDMVVHLAAQPGVRASIDQPLNCVKSNCDGFVAILECARRYNVQHVVYASSSSVYGSNKVLPYSTEQTVDNPVSLYAATKKANELMAHSYAYVHGLPVTGLRFFTVYGPWGRPDMAAYLFTKAIFDETPIRIFNFGMMKRDFTYIDDISRGVISTLLGPESDSFFGYNRPHATSIDGSPPYKIYNIGNSNSVNILDFIEILEDLIGKKAIRELLPMQAGDVLETYADVSELTRDTGFAPSTPLRDGLSRFVEWYRSYHRC